ncbi:hypothetical protein TNCV_1165981 [Trichonephila clavipes]|uniref:Uncharacterized protein n=1 Tax=Trichonephila clavipes TaxID=2585209 RepID=A0A8X6T1U7_TRICX|nr:hypothetical protein TNCV_1165981 [Trichonephila clavipes]
MGSEKSKVLEYVHSREIGDRVALKRKSLEYPSLAVKKEAAEHLNSSVCHAWLCEMQDQISKSSTLAFLNKEETNIPWPAWQQIRPKRHLVEQIAAVIGLCR